MAWIAAWLGWTLDAFDFTIFLLITHGFCDAYADQHNGYRYKRCHCIVNQSGNERQSVRFRLDEALVSEKIRFRIDDS